MGVVACELAHELAAPICLGNNVNVDQLLQIASGRTRTHGDEVLRLFQQIMTILLFPLTHRKSKLIGKCSRVTVSGSITEKFKSNTYSLTRIPDNEVVSLTTLKYFVQKIYVCIMMLSRNK